MHILIRIWNFIVTVRRVGLAVVILLGATGAAERSCSSSYTQNFVPDQIIKLAMNRVGWTCPDGIFKWRTNTFRLIKEYHNNKINVEQEVATEADSLNGVDRKGKIVITPVSWRYGDDGEWKDGGGAVQNQPEHLDILLYKKNGDWFIDDDDSPLTWDNAIALSLVYTCNGKIVDDEAIRGLTPEEKKHPSTPSQ